MLETKQHIHFVGVGGIGMSALALLLSQQGHEVSGSDQQDSELLDALRSAGIRVHIGHAADHASGADLVVYSSAVKADNAERQFAETHAIPEIRRAELLGLIAARYDHALAIAGTHGKTTTTGMIGNILVQANLDPAILVGGILPNLNSNLRLGGSEYIVVEADEYDRSFLALSPDHILVTTLEADHLDIYKDLQDVRDTFLKFVSKLKADQLLILHGDDGELQLLATRYGQAFTTYGLEAGNDYQAEIIEQTTFHARFNVIHDKHNLGEIHIQMPGKHNILNALGAFCLTHSMGLPFEDIRSGLQNFQGVHRRFQLMGTLNGVQFIDDYAHHPSELSATLEGARKGWPDSRIIAVFQPHLYSRTRDFAAEFGAALALADVPILTDIYPAREKPIPGVSSSLILAANPSRIIHLAGIQDVHAYLAPLLKSGDMVITLGAGDIWKLHALFLKGTANG